MSNLVINIPAGSNIDRYLKNHRNPGTIFVLEEGVYFTSGMYGFADFDYCALAPQCSLLGVSSLRTFLKLVDPVMGQKDLAYTEILTGGARTSGTCSSLTIRGLTILSLPSTIHSVGVHIWGSGVTMSDVVVRGVSGKRSLPYPNEGFGILINSPAVLTGQTNGGNMIRECGVVISSPNTYVCGIYVGVEKKTAEGMVGSILVPSNIVDCYVHCFGSGENCTAFGLNDRVNFNRCSAIGCEGFFFSDTGTVS